MLKNKITHKELLTQENKEVLEKWNIITENPLAYFDPNDPTSMQKHNQRVDDCYKYLSQFSVDEIIGRTVVIHSDSDDFHTQPAGNAGKKIACGVIRKI